MGKSWVETIIRLGLRQSNPELMCPVKGCLHLPHSNSRYCRRHLYNHTPIQSEVEFEEVYLKVRKEMGA